MPVESEYTRTYRPFVVSPKSPVEGVPAGMSSAQMGVTQEPPVGMKKKIRDHESKVTFLTSGGELDCNHPEKEIKSLKYKAGYRHQDVRTPTEYQREYGWPEQTSIEAPLLNTANMLHNTRPVPRLQVGSDSPPSRCKHYQEQGRFDPGRSERNKRGQISNGSPQLDQQDSSEEPVVTGKPGLGSKGTAKSKGQAKKDRERLAVHGTKQRKFIEELMSKQTRKESSKKAHKKMIKQFVTEYQRQFGKSSVRKAEKAKKSTGAPNPAGMPRTLTDSSDPRLLKHSRLPVTISRTSLSNGGWMTDYRANYKSPSEGEYTGDGLKDSPEPEVRVKDSPPIDDQGFHSEQPVPQTHSWYNQLVELRERAERYKKRAEGVNIRRLLPLTRQDLAAHGSIPSVISESTSQSSPTPSDLVSYAYSDCPHHVKADSPPKLQIPPPPVVEHRPGVGDCTSNVDTTNGYHHPSTTMVNRRPTRDMQVHDIEEETTISEPIHHVQQPLRNEPSSTTVHQPPPTEADDGRVHTPIIQKSSSDFRRHHLDRTTPVAGGLFISPEKQPPEVVLPYPPVSPKFRRDMRSSAPISPAPQTRDECVQVEVSSSDGDIPPFRPSPVNSPPRPVPASSSPFHSHCVPMVKSKSSSMRKLDFVKPSQTRASKTLPKSYSYRVEGLTPASKDSCEICGAHLKSSVNAQSTSGQASKQFLRSKLSSSAANGSLTNSKQPQVSVTSSALHANWQQPLSTTNYMTRLPPQVEPQQRDFDESSLASLSISSCSVASDVLRKARERRDHFWTQPPHVTAT